jgi:outer membrane lipoprotein-sorting protein
MANRSVIRTLRTTPTRRLVAGCLVTVAVAATGTAIATAGGSGPVPPAKPLPVAIHDALGAPAVPGVRADITFTNTLVDAGSLQISDPLLAGAHGRLWVGADGRVRLELQSDQGDAQILSDGSTVSVYDASQRTLYRAKLPAHPKDATGRSGPGRQDSPPSIAQIESKLTEITRHAMLSGADPSDVAGRPAYTVKVAPRSDGGLLGHAELAWDAEHGVPLRAAVYSTTGSSPVLEIKATNISFESVPDSTFDVAAPKGTKIVDMSPSGGSDGGSDSSKRNGDEPKPVSGVAAVAQAVPFTLSAPATLDGMPRGEVRRIDESGHTGALVRYGKGLGGLAVLELPADAAKPEAKTTSAHQRHGHHGHDHAASLPTVSVNGASGQELDTALGSLIRFTRAGVAYTVAGSVSPAAAKAAARGL